LSYASLKSKLRKANKNNASYAVIIGDEELTSNTAILKSLKEKDSEQSILKIDELKKFILNLE
jgi:histidyl-tRNA synthetase